MSATQTLDRWLALLPTRRASDLMLVAGAPASLHVDGAVVPLEEPPLSGAEIEELTLPALPPHAQVRYRECGIADASYPLAGTGRFRINLHRERGRPAATIRLLPSRLPRLGDLGLPPVIETLARIPRGLVLVGGPMVAGKTTTLTALVQEINRKERRHIITIEDPIEYEYAHEKSLVEQIEIGVDAPDFPTALRAALRQAPDVIVLGEMRDPESMRIAVAAAETGHLVFSTIHGTDVASSVGRIVDSFPVERQGVVRQELAMALAAVMTQQLLLRRGGGRVVATELLLVGYGARQHIRRNALQYLHQEITLTQDKGSFSMEASLAQLFHQGDVDRDEVMCRSLHPEVLQDLIG
jgi:twitching motility protein PilT